MVRSPDAAPLAIPVSSPEVAYSVPPTPPTAAAFSQPHLAYLPSLSQPSFLMLYGAPTPEGLCASEGQGQRSPRAAEAREKRKSVDEELEPNQAGKRQRREEERPSLQVSFVSVSITISNLVPTGFAQGAVLHLPFMEKGIKEQGIRLTRLL